MFDSPILFIAAQVFAAQLGARTDVETISDGHLAQLADSALRAARALVAAAQPPQPEAPAEDAGAAGAAQS